MQRQALVNLIGDSMLSVGLADIGAGYVKILFYGAAVMPEFKYRD